MKVTKERLLLGLEALLLCVVLIMCFQPRQVIVDAEQMIPLPELASGAYELRIDYDMQEAHSCSLQLKGGEDYFQSVLANPVELNADAKQARMPFYLRDKAVDLHVEVQGEGAPSLTVHGMEVVRHAGAARMLLCLLLLVLTPLNLLYALYRYMGQNTVSREQLLVWIGVPAIGLVASIPLFTDYLIAGGEVEQALRTIDQVASGADWSKEAWMLALPILLRKLGFTLNLAYGVSLFLRNLCAAWIAYGVCRLCCGNRVVAWLGSLFWTLAPWRILDLYVAQDIKIWQYLLWIVVIVILCYGCKKMLACTNQMQRNIFFVAVCGGYLLMAIWCMNDMLIWTEGIIRRY